MLPQAVCISERTAVQHSAACDPPMLGKITASPVPSALCTRHVSFADNGVYLQIADGFPCGSTSA